jgi:hypothetical protein
MEFINSQFGIGCVIIPEFMFSSYKLGLSLGNWLGHSGFSSEHHRKAMFVIHVVGDYLWLIGGLVLIWIGLIGMYVTYSTGMPSSPSLGFSPELFACTGLSR